MLGWTAWLLSCAMQSIASYPWLGFMTVANDSNSRAAHLRVIMWMCESIDRSIGDRQVREARPYQIRYPRGR